MFLAPQRNLLSCIPKFILASFSALALSSCLDIPLDSEAGSKDDDEEKMQPNCAPATLGCVCAQGNICGTGLTCVQGICIVAPGSGTGTGTVTATGTTSAITTTAGGITTIPGTTGSADMTVDTTNSNSGGGQASDSSDDSGTKNGPGDTSTPFPSCDDSIQNGDESDIDCGGSMCAPCQDGKNCKVKGDCESQNCQAGVCRPPEKACRSNSDCSDSQACTIDRCVEGLCAYTNQSEGRRCDDQDPCTAQDQCVSGRCEGQDTRVLTESFSGAGPWAFLNHSASGRSLWEIGAAKASACAPTGFSQDPAKDHSSDADNGLMGMSVGGCHDDPSDNELHCAWSDYVDVSFFEREVHFSFWRHMSTPGYNSSRPRVRNFKYYRVKGDSRIHQLATGWPNGISDRRWTIDESVFSPIASGEISIGICYRRESGTGQFAGWSVDDVKIRQRGCIE